VRRNPVARDQRTSVREGIVTMREFLKLNSKISNFDSAADKIFE
jgi:hypothetical protein